MWHNLLMSHKKETVELYAKLIENDIHPESAQAILPQSLQVDAIVTGNVRDMMHYLELRTDHGTQPEHKVLANLMRDEFMKKHHDLSIALGWIKEEPR